MLMNLGALEPTLSGLAVAVSLISAARRCFWSLWRSCSTHIGLRPSGGCGRVRRCRIGLSPT